MQHVQVVTAYRLLELVPSVVTAAFAQQELKVAAEAQHVMAAPIEQQHQQLLQQLDHHRKALEPSMAQPSRYHFCPCQLLAFGSFSYAAVPAILADSETHVLTSLEPYLNARAGTLGKCMSSVHECAA